VSHEPSGLLRVIKDCKIILVEPVDKPLCLASGVNGSSVPHGGVQIEISNKNSGLINVGPSWTAEVFYGLAFQLRLVIY
jgi:hypothetical protein